MVANDDSVSSCPVDHTARAAWMEKAKSSDAPRTDTSQFSTSSNEIGSDSKPMKTRPLSHDREVSTIPRADLGTQTTTPNSNSVSRNHENDAPHGLPSGNWIYPSEKMFFEAMKRKNYSPEATDMAAIVPIHNAVNERAWREIKNWEERFNWSKEANTLCGGPRLHSFSGDSKKLTPRARWNSLLGYQKPFDRHDWVIERCPGQPNVEYVIDFYSGKRQSNNQPLSFYLDVRPKLNSWEGWRMRVAKAFGM